ncbi:MAG: hypothetical protein M1324_01090 [Patescibacteria group bacterium]|nr:hypothetical protein [Patescibacteria group bacterium]
MKIVICASTIFSDKIIEVANQLEKVGHIVFIPYLTNMIKEGKLNFDQLKKDKETKGDWAYRKGLATEVNMIKRYYNLIKECDCVLVLNYDKKEIKNYIGGSVLMEIGFAHVLNKKIFLYNNVPVMSYTDEILDTKPIVINGDLSKIE